MVIESIDAFKEVLPEDLSVNVDIVGEGGGTEVAGHPTKFSLVQLNLILRWADLALTRYIDFNEPTAVVVTAR